MSPTNPAVLKTLSIQEILTQYPQTEPVFSQFGLLAYAKTPTAHHENLEASALTHAMPLNPILDALMEALQ